MAKNEWLNRLEILIGESKVEMLQNKTVAVFGLGGVGSYSVEALARSGIGKIAIVDYDVVDPTNLNRQLIATRENIGRKKTDVTQERILAINPECEVIKKDLFINKENLDDIFSLKIDGAIDAIDVLSSKVELIDRLIKEKIDFISSLGMGGRLDPTKIEITTLKKTKYDRLAKALRRICREREISLDFPVVISTEETHGKVGKNEDGNTRKEKNPIGSSAFVPAVGGITAASYILRKIIE